MSLKKIVKVPSLGCLDMSHLYSVLKSVQGQELGGGGLDQCIAYLVKLQPGASTLQNA